MLRALPHEQRQVDVEEPPEQQREEADDDVGDRRGEVGAQLLVGDRQDVTHAVHCTPPSGCTSPAGGRRCRRRAGGGALSSVVTCRKISSRLMRIGRSSSSPQPRVTTARAMSRRMSRAALALHLEAAHGRRDGPTAPTRVTPGIAAQHRRGLGALRVDLHVQRLGALQPRGQVVRRVDGDDAALVDDDDALAGLRDLRQDVRAEDDGVIAGEAADEVARLDDLLGVEAGGRLVEDQHFRVVDERLREADALPVALRELAAVRGRPCRRRGCASSPRRRASRRSFGGTPLIARRSRGTRARSCRGRAAAFPAGSRCAAWLRSGA